MKLAGILCPGEGPLPCSGNGHCDFTIGQCTCNIGHQGSDCSGKISNNGILFHCKYYLLAKIQFFSCVPNPTVYAAIFNHSNFLL